MDNANVSSMSHSSILNVFDSHVFITVLILSVFSVLIFFRPTTNAYSQDGLDCENSVSNPVQNCGFETGDFSGWVTQDLSDPFFPLQVGGAGITPDSFGFFVSDPPQGVFAVLTGFDGNGPGTISVAQDVVLPTGADTLVFQFECAWNLLDFGDSPNRTFEVNIEPAGGGAPLQTDTILTAVGGTTAIPDSGGDIIRTVDMSSFSGQAVRISFDWIVPGNFTGPAFCQLDNVIVNPSNPIPTLSEWGMISAAAGLMLVGIFFVMKRRRVAGA